MWTRADLKANGKVAFKRNYWTCVAVSVLTAILCGEGLSGTSGFANGFESVTENSSNGYYGSAGHHGFMGQYGKAFGIMAIVFVIIALIFAVAAACFQIFVGNVIKVGSARYYMENREHKTRVAQMFYGFRNKRYGKVVLTMFLRDLYVFLWSLLLIVPGVIKSYSYMMVPYILSENPDMDRRRAIELSEEMMQGHKMDAFMLDLSFLGWVFLSVLTCGILMVFYVNPYVDASYAEFYSAVKAEALQKQITSEYELPGHFYETV